MRRGELGLVLLLVLGVGACDDNAEGAPSPSAGGAVGDGGAASGGSFSGGVASGGSTQAPSEAEILRAAVILGSCWADDGINRNLAWLLEPARFSHPWDFSRQVHCIATAGEGCEALTRCVGFRRELYEGENPTECVGDVIHYREADQEATFDCASLGLTCHPGRFCVPADAPSCDESDYVGVCRAGGRATGCDNGHEVEGAPCTDFGLACLDGTCRGDGASCAGGNGYHGADIEFEGLGCDGDVLHACTGGREHSVDCSERGTGYGCREVDGYFFCGRGAECLPGEATHGWGSSVSCEGSEVVFCREGVHERIDCAELGFTGCEAGTGRIGGCVPNFNTE